MEELEAYLGFMILMGIVQMPSIRDYWSKHETFHYKPIASCISRNRFLDVHRFLHFVDNDTLPLYGAPNYSKIQKIKPILTSLSNAFGEHFTNGQDIAIDEAMVKYKGRSSLKQYMPKKPIKRGFKLWMRADSNSAYVSKFTVYEGKIRNQTEKGLGANTVMRLTESIQGHYHHIYFDNFFTGIDLLLNLLRNGTYGCGTMRQDRKGFPSSLKPFVKKGLQSRGDHMSTQNGNLSVVLWQDSKPISFASTNTDLKVAKVVNRKQRDGSTQNVKCPETVTMYNANMGGVDRNDQLRGYYNVQIKSRRFYKYLFFAALDITITNCFILSKFFPNVKQKNIKEFRVLLADMLIGDYNSRKRRGRPSLMNPIKRFCSSHFPTKADKKGNRCYFCQTHLDRRETVWQCKDCDMNLCHTGKEDDCFYIYHKNYGPENTD